MTQLNHWLTPTLRMSQIMKFSLWLVSSMATAAVGWIVKERFDARSNLGRSRSALYAMMAEIWLAKVYYAGILSDKESDLDLKDYAAELFYSAVSPERHKVTCDLVEANKSAMKREAAATARIRGYLGALPSRQTEAEIKVQGALSFCDALTQELQLGFLDLEQLLTAVKEQNREHMSVLLARQKVDMQESLDSIARIDNTMKASKVLHEALVTAFPDSMRGEEDNVELSKTITA